MQQPTCTNIRIRSTLDAHKIFYGVHLGILPMVHRRLDAHEQLALGSGCVYVWEERGPHELTGLGIKRFTEGRRWSRWRVRDKFQLYCEKYTLPGDSQNSRTPEVHPPSNWVPLVRQTYSVSVETSEGLRKWHLTAYFTQTTVDQLDTIDNIQDVGTAVIPDGMFRSKNRKLDGSQHRSAEPPVPTVRQPCAGQGPQQTDPSFQLSSYLPSSQHTFPRNAPISPSSDSRPPNVAPSPSPYSPVGRVRVALFHGPRHGSSLMSNAALQSYPEHSSAPLALLPDRERNTANGHAYQPGHPHHQIAFPPSNDALIVATVAIVALMVQLLTTNLNAIGRAILSFGITFELLGLLFIISFSFPQRFIGPPMAPRTPIYFATGAPTVLILMGIFGLSAAIVVETVKFSLSVAIAMSCILIIAGMLCLLVSLLRVCGRL